MMATASELSPASIKKVRQGGSSSPTSSTGKGAKAETIRKTSRPSSAGPTIASPSTSGASDASNLPTLLVSDPTTTSFPSRVVGWKTSKSFSQTMSSIEVPAGSSLRSSVASTSRPAAIRIQMMEPVGPSAYSLSLQAQRTPSEQWKMLKNRLLRKKSSEESITPEMIDKLKQTIRSPQEEGIVCRTNELKRLLRGSESETGDGVIRSSNRSSVDESEKKTEASGEQDEQSNCSFDSEKQDEDTDAAGAAAVSQVKWDESNTLDASVLGDAIEAFLKGLKTTSPSPSSSSSRCTEKRVSFR